MRQRLLPFASIVLTALAPGPAGAHLVELPDKIGLSQPQYFVVQGICRGLTLLGVVLFDAPTDADP